MIQITNGNVESVVDCLRIIYQKYGKTVFAEGKKLYSLLSDTIPDKEKELKALKIACFENAFSAFATIQEYQYEAEAKKTIRYLIDDCMLSEVWAQKIVGWLLEALGYSSIKDTAELEERKHIQTSTTSIGQQGNNSFSYQANSQKNTQQPVSKNYANDLEIVAGMVVRYKGTGGKVVIPKNVRGIKEHAFFNEEKITEVIFEEGCKEIGTGAFEGCIRLSRIELPFSLKKINRYVFKGCISIKKIVIPWKIEFIDHGIFDDCQKLTVYTGQGDNGYRKEGLDLYGYDSYLESFLGREKYIRWNNIQSNTNSSEKFTVFQSYYGSSKLAEFNFFGEKLGKHRHILDLGASWDDTSKFIEIRITDDSKGMFGDWQVDGVWKKFDKDSIKEIRIVRAGTFQKGRVEYHINPNGIIKHTFKGKENKWAEKLYAVMKENNVKVSIE